MRATRRTFLVVGAAALAGCAGDDGGDAAGTTTATTTGEPTETTAGTTAMETMTAEPTPTATETTERTETTANETATGTAAGTTADGGPTVQVRSHPDLGEILVGPDGMTLYMFDQDTQGEGASTCYDSCAGTWPPLIAGSPTSGEGVAAELATFDRETGDAQVAAAGWPLYYYAPDESPGDATGQGVGDVWWVLAPDGTPIRPD